MFRMRSLAAVVTVLLLAGTGNAAWAQKGRGGPPPHAQTQSRPTPQDSLSDSVRRAARDSRGQVLSAERVPFDGREMHRVKVLDDRGRVRVYMDDPQRTRRGDRDRNDDDDDRARSRGRPTRDDDD